MGITFGDHLIDSGYYDITPEQEREIEAREECARRGLNPDDDAADGVAVWMVVDQEILVLDIDKWVREIVDMTHDMKAELRDIEKLISDRLMQAYNAGIAATPAHQGGGDGD
jgi:hypothetical protein